jgi:ABC-type Zn uptake system ZnuABC Zn-binding protein ZnuA
MSCAINLNSWQKCMKISKEIEQKNITHIVVETDRNDTPLLTNK